jgi:16S rRNA (uracil1498-N3)-methyltransferase
VTPPVFFVTAAVAAQDEIVLDGPEGRHAATVRRLAVGERVDVSDGVGGVAECVVTGVARDRLTLAVRARRVVEAPSPRLVVVQALAKGSRADDAVEAMTEVGVDEIVPWSAARSIVKWQGARGEAALEGWRSTAREAAKQSRRAWLPVVAPLVSTRDVAARLGAASAAVVLHESASAGLAGLDVPTSGEIVIVVGPEGGLTDEELAAFAAAGATAYVLGPSVLRTSTAGVAAAAVLLSRTPRWSGPPHTP